MAKKKSKSPQDKRLIDIVCEDYDNDLRSIELLHDEFEEKEKILFGEVSDSISKNETSSSVQDPTLLSSIIKQNNAVMAQMPSGKVRALSQKNRGKSLFMDLILHQHVLPHATTQYDAFTKLWLLSFYRKVYGSFGVLVDNVVNKGSGYIGPDFTLIPIRAIIPQAGKFTVEDSERVMVRSKVTKDWLKSRDKSIWKNIDNLIESKPSEDDPDQQTYIQRKYAQDLEQKGEWEIITRYEKDRWVTFSKDQRMILRDIPNPQKNSELPVVMCHSYPLLDRFIGLGEFERGKTLHYAMSSLINLYMDGVKMSIFPPLKIDPNSVADWDSFQLGAGATWLMKTGQLGGIEQMQLSPLGLNTFQSTYGFLKAGMLTLTNTTDTGVSAETDPGFGKSQRYSEPVLTPSGWVLMGDIKVGDYVIDDLGKPAKVLEIHEQGEIDAYDVEFMDGSKTSCSLDHLWTVYSSRKHNEKETISLAEIIDKGWVREQLDKRDNVVRNEYLYHVPLVQPVEFEERELPLDPYLLGLLLGDGGFSEDRDTISFTNSKPEIQEKVRILLPEGDELRIKKSKNNNEFRIYGKTVEIIKQLGLKGHKAASKFIPVNYLYNSVENRKKLFQGLMDTDGHVLKSNSSNIEYTTVSERLGNDFLELARSLGYYAHLNIGVSSAVYKGEKRFYGNKYRINICGRTKKAIVNISKSSPEKSRCLFVDTPNHLYVTADYTITHNTPQALKMQAMTEGQRTQFDRRMLELATEKIFDKMIDIVAKRQEQPMELYLYEEDLRKVEEVAPDVVEMFETGDMGKVTIKPSDIKNCEYRYEIDSGSTVKKDEIIENQTLSELIGLIMKLPGAMEQIQQGGLFNLGDKSIDFGELLKRWIISSGITDWDKIVTENAQQEGANFEDPALMEQFAQMGGMPQGQQMPQGQPGMPPQGMPMQQQPQFQSQDEQIMQVMAELEQMGRG